MGRVEMLVLLLTARRVAREGCVASQDVLQIFVIATQLLLTVARPTWRATPATATNVGCDARQDEPVLVGFAHLVGWRVRLPACPVDAPWVRTALACVETCPRTPATAGVAEPHA